MQESAVKKPPEGKIGESEKQDYQTPEVYEVNSLRIDSRLPRLMINVDSDTIYSDSSTLQLSVTLPLKVSRADVFLLNNGREKDMFYQVDPGEHSFQRIFLEDSVNNLIFFYRVGSRRSLPEKIVVIKKSNR